MKKDTMPEVARFWNQAAGNFDAIYSGRKSPLGRALDRWLRKDMYQRFDWVMERAGEVAGLHICDVGCGSGRFVVEFARRGAAHVTGLDVAPEMLKLANALVREAGVSGQCEFIEGDVLNWNSSRTHDLTIAIGLWDYIADPPARLRQVRAFTRGKFLSAWPRLWTWRMPVRKVRLQYMEGCPVYFFRKPEAIRMVEEAGFKVDRCDTVGKLFCIESHTV